MSLKGNSLKPFFLRQNSLFHPQRTRTLREVRIWEKLKYMGCCIGEGNCPQQQNPESISAVQDYAV
jgi:hypothetical protein